MRDVGLAEELAQDALVAALEQWPESGIPDKPGAWLMAAAKNRAIDRLRRAKLIERKHEELGRDLETGGEGAAPDLDAALDDDIGDDLLRLMFTACHPVLSTEARVALTLRLLGGLTTEEIARAFLVPEPTIAQRIVRAKRTLAERQVPFEVPRGAERDRAPRLGAGGALPRVQRGLHRDRGRRLDQAAAVRGGAAARPRAGGAGARGAGGARPRGADGDPGLAAQGARSARTGSRSCCSTRTARAGTSCLIRRGLAALARAEALGRAPGAYVLQAAIAACHARARTAEETDWGRIAGLYGTLGRLTPSPVVELNRAVAVGMASGPAAGLAIVDALTDEPALKAYHLLPSVRGDLLQKLGRLDEARAEFERAASLTRNERERRLLLDRAAACGDVGRIERRSP